VGGYIGKGIFLGHCPEFIYHWNRIQFH
jgi:hypothetical protein